MLSELFVEKDRIRWIESLRAVAMLMVVIPHFIAMFCPSVFNLWHTHSWLLNGITGKHGVAIFCVLIGYFSSQKKHAGLPTYVVRRYLQFAINIFIVLLPFSIVFSIVSKASQVDLLKGIADSMIETVLFQSGLNPTLWCVKEMFFGSLICYVLGNYCEMENKWKELVYDLAIGVFLYFFNVWIAICVLGAALRVFSSIEICDRRKLLLCVLFIVAIPLLYRHAESRKTYMMQGVSSSLFMYICICVSSYKFKFNKKHFHLRILPFMGNVSFYMFLWHTPVNKILKALDLDWNMWVLFGVSFFCSLLFSFIQHVINKKWINPLNKKIKINVISN